MINLCPERSNFCRFMRDKSLVEALDNPEKLITEQRRRSKMTEEMNRNPNVEHTSPTIPERDHMHDREYQEFLAFRRAKQVHMLTWVKGSMMKKPQPSGIILRRTSDSQTEKIFKHHQEVISCQPETPPIKHHHLRYR